MIANIVLGGEGEQQRVSKRVVEPFSNLQNTDNYYASVPRTFVHDCKSTAYKAVLIVHYKAISHESSP